MKMTLDKAIYYSFIAIVVYLIVVNYKGAIGVGNTVFGGWAQVVTALQGRSGTKTVIVRRNGRGGR